MSSIDPLIAQFAMHTRLFHNVTVAFTDDAASVRTNGANHVK